MHAETITSFVVLCRTWVVIKHPAGMLRPSRLMDQMANLLVRAIPEPSYATILTVLLPQVRIDMPFAVERSNKLIPMLS